MITGFEKETSPLTVYERDEILPKVIFLIDNAADHITNKQICEAIASSTDSDNEFITSINETRVRKIINHIRINNLLLGLVATSNGYYLTRDVNDITRYIQSLDNREAAIRAVKNRLKEYLIKLQNSNQVKLVF